MSLISKETTVQFIKFSIIGVSNTVIYFCIYYFLLWLNIFYLYANIIAFILGVLNSYYWNRKFTFNQSIITIYTIIRLYGSYGITALLGTGLLYLFVDIMGVNKYICPIINIGPMTCINFILNKYFVFGNYQ